LMAVTLMAVTPIAVAARGSDYHGR
jgi:hypothetical protein